MFKDIRKPCRITLSMDRVASDGRLTATDEIAGLCEHATEELNSVKDGKDLCVACAIRQAIRDGKGLLLGSNWAGNISDLQCGACVVFIACLCSL
jgi:hypothetical protein